MVDGQTHLGIVAHRVFRAVVHEEVLSVGLGVHHGETFVHQEVNVGGVDAAYQVHRAGFQRDGTGGRIRNKDEIQVLDVGLAAKVVGIGGEVEMLAPDMLLDGVGSGAVDALGALAQIVAVFCDGIGVQNQPLVAGERGQASA